MREAARPLRILLIDDSAAYCEEFCALLSAGAFADAQVDHVATAAEGARVMNRGDHDIYFVDYRLPGDSGVELIRQARTAGVDRPIICLTGLDHAWLDLEAEQAGATGYLSKGGFSSRALGRTIRFAVRNAASLPMPRDAEARFRMARETANIGTWDWDILRDEMIWDARLFQLFGCNPLDGPTANEVWRRALRPAMRAAFEEAAHDSIVSDQPFLYDFEARWDDGSVHHMRAAGRVVRHANGRAARMTGITWDITKLRLLVADLAQARDAAERANQAKSRFLTGMSHEVRTPLNGILGYAHMLRLGGGLTARQDQLVEGMLQAGSHLLDMINNVLDLSAIEADRLEMRMAEINPHVFLAECLDTVRPGADVKALELVARVAPDMPRRITTEPTRLRQIVLNLLGNAVKFTDRGSVEIVLRKAAGGRMRIEVVDTGPGIPAACRDQLFQDFGRLDTVVTRSVEGSGLGLALSARLAALLDGRLGQLDNPGGGSIFWLELPFGQEAGWPTLADGSAPALAAATAAATPASTPAPTRALRILVVDDVAMNRDVAHALLTAAGHEVTCAPDGPGAVAAVAANGFDMVLMDVRMPEMDGLEATRRIRRLPTPRGEVPIIGLTAQVFGPQVEACRQAGMNGHLAKPYSPETLAQAVARAINGKPTGPD